MAFFCFFLSGPRGPHVKDWPARRREHRSQVARWAASSLALRRRVRRRACVCVCVSSALPSSSALRTGFGGRIHEVTSDDMGRITLRPQRPRFPLQNQCVFRRFSGLLRFLLIKVFRVATRARRPNPPGKPTILVGLRMWSQEGRFLVQTQYVFRRFSGLLRFLQYTVFWCCDPGSEAESKR